MQKKLPDQMMNMIIKNVDKRNTRGGSFNASQIIQSIERSDNNHKQLLN